MPSIKQLMQSYASYHRDARNKATHFVGVPLIVYAIFVLLSLVKLPGYENLPFPYTVASIFLVATTFYYFKLDVLLTLIQLPFSFALLYFANETANLPQVTALMIFAAAFVLGWGIQFLGHYFEGRKPALFDNILQIFNAPLFLAMEVAFVLGLHQELRHQIETDRLN